LEGEMMQNLKMKFIAIKRDRNVAKLLLVAYKKIAFVKSIAFKIVRISGNN
jgi:hypothetical protein